jgi:hypothetical protein
MLASQFSKNEVKMNNLSEMYFNIQSRLFPMVEEEIGELN